MRKERGELKERNGIEEKEDKGRRDAVKGKSQKRAVGERKDG